MFSFFDPFVSFFFREGDRAHLMSREHLLSWCRARFYCQPISLVGKKKKKGEETNEDFNLNIQIGCGRADRCTKFICFVFLAQIMAGNKTKKVFFFFFFFFCLDYTLSFLFQVSGFFSLSVVLFVFEMDG